MFNELEVKTKTPTEFDEVVQKCKDMFAGFENTLANIETKMGGRKGEQQGFRRYLKKPKERRKSEALGRIEKKKTKRKQKDKKD